MGTIQVLKKMVTAFFFKRKAALFIFLQLSAFYGFSQAAVENDTTMNKATRSVFAELKTMVRSADSNLTTILIIVGVLAIVGIAMYISFNEPEEKPQKSKK